MNRSPFLSPRWHETILPWFFSCVLFFVLPFLVLAYGLGCYLDDTTEKSMEVAWSRADASLVSLLPRSTSHKYFERMFNAMRRRILLAPDPVKALTEDLSRLRRRFPGIIQTVAFDSRREVITSVSDRELSVPLAKKVYAAFLDLQNDPRGLERMKKEWNSLKSFIGESSYFQQVVQAGPVFFKAGLGENPFWFGSFVTEKGGFLIRLFQPDSWDTMILENRCDLFQRRFPGRRVELGVWKASNLHERAPDLRAAIEAFQERGITRRVCQHRLLTIAALHPSYGLYAISPKPEFPGHSWLRTWILGLGNVGFALLTICSYAGFTRKERRFISLRWKILVLFIFAGFLPLIALILAGHQYLQLSEKSLRQRVHAEAESKLRAVDEKFSLVKSLAENNLRRIMGNGRIPLAEVRQRFMRSPFQKGLLHGAGEVLMFDTDGNLVDSIARKTSDRGMQVRRLLKGLMKNLLNSLNHEASSTEFSTVDLLLDVLPFQKNPILEMAENLNCLVEYSWSINQTLTFLSSFQNAAGRHTHILAGHWERTGFERDYLKTALVQSKRRGVGPKIFAYTDFHNAWYPQSADIFGGLAGFVGKLRLHQGTMVGDLRRGRQFFLATGIKAAELQNTYLVSLQDRNILNLDREQRLRSIGQFLVIYLGLFLVMFLSLCERVFVPISQLALGLKAVEARDFGFRLPPAEPDELGKWVPTFNQIMEGFSELDVARIVQECLFPREGQIVGEYAMCGKTISSRELGGDFHEIRSLADGKVIIVVGSISGRGIPAALGMAMVKAVMEDISQQERDGVAMIEAIQGILCHSFPGAYESACCLGILDSRSHQLQVFHSGNPSPLVFQPGKPGPIVPMGPPGHSDPDEGSISRKNLEILPGEGLMFHTKGVFGSDHSRASFNRFWESLTIQEKTVPEEFCRAFGSWKLENSKKEAPEGDSTVLMVVRKKSEQR